jgi:hypothetical protein
MEYQSISNKSLPGMSSRELPFIHHSSSGKVSSTKRQRQIVHSNAARAAHAETRRLRISRYQVAKAQERSKLVDLESGSDAVAAPRIVKLLSASRKDPFTSFVRQFNPVEHFLLDHCMLPRTRNCFGSFLIHYSHVRRCASDALQRACRLLPEPHDRRIGATRTGQRRSS